ncbi:MAG: fibronectin type III domain-containing protein [Epsilonproteobacteria bacterium]|nr:fibronectin type III domain-containing protein [Campylobacterota bacterium]
MNAIAFEWHSISDERVNGFYIYKQTVGKTDSELTYYKTINNRFATHFLDNEIKPNTNYKYSFKTFSKDAESKMSKVKDISSLPVLKSVIWIQSIGNMPRTAKIIWRPHINQKVKSYHIERKTLEDEKFKDIAIVEGRLSAEYIDMNLKDNYVYNYRIRVETFDGLISTPSKVVKVITKPLPKSIEHILTTTDLPKKIDITWEKSLEEDFDHYNLYRATSSDGSYKLIAKLYNNRFTDAIDEDAKEYFYRVSVVEKNTLESIHNKISIQGITLGKPEAPSLIEAKLVGDKINLKWTSTDSRVKSFIVVKKIKTGWFKAKTQEFRDITQQHFEDSDIGPNITYMYKVYALDKYLILSKPSIEVEVKTPKNLADNRKKQLDETPVQKNNSKTQEVIIPLEDFN